MQRDDILFSLNKFSANRLEILTKTSCTLLEYSHWNDQEHFFRKARPNACSVAVRLKLVCTTRLLLLERTNSVRTRSHVVCVCVCVSCECVCMVCMLIVDAANERPKREPYMCVLYASTSSSSQYVLCCWLPLPLPRTYICLTHTRTNINPVITIKPSYTM